MARRAKKTPIVSTNGGRRHHDPGSDCEIVSSTPRKRAMKKKKQQRRSQQGTPTAKRSGKSSIKNTKNTTSPPSSNATIILQEARSRQSTVPASNARTTSINRASAPPTAHRRHLQLPPTSPAPVSRAKTVNYVDLTELTSSSEDDLDDDSDDDDDGDVVEVIDADVFRKAAARRATPKLFKQRPHLQPQQHQQQYPQNPTRAATPVLLESSSECDSESESYGRGDHKVQLSPSRRYMKRRPPKRDPKPFQRSPAPSPEETPDARRNVRASTVPPPASKKLTFMHQKPGAATATATHQSDKPKQVTPPRDGSQPKQSNLTAQHTNERVKAKQETLPPSTHSEPPRSRKSSKVVKPGNDVQPVRPTSDRQRSSSVPPPRDTPPLDSPTQATGNRSVPTKKTPEETSSIKPRPILTSSPSSKLNNKTSAPSTSAAQVKQHPSDDDTDDEQSSSSSDEEDEDGIEARSLPPPKAHRFSYAMRPTIDRLQQSIRDGRVSIPPVKQELRVTRTGREAITAEMERRGITTSASYNEFISGLMSEYSRLLYRSPIPHLSTMTYLMNDLQDECLEIEARRPASERVGRAAVNKNKKKKQGEVDFNRLFSAAKDDSDSDSDDISTDGSSSLETDEDECEDVGIWSVMVNRAKRDDGERIAVKKEKDSKPIMIKREDTQPVPIKQENAEPVVIKKEPAVSTSTSSVILGLCTPETSPEKKKKKKRSYPREKPQSAVLQESLMPPLKSKASATSSLPTTPRAPSSSACSSSLPSSSPRPPVTMVSRGTQTDDEATPIIKNRKRPREEVEVLTPQGRNNKRQRTGALHYSWKGKKARLPATPRATPGSGRKRSWSASMKKAGMW